MKVLAIIAIAGSALAGHLTAGGPDASIKPTATAPAASVPTADDSDCAGGQAEVVTARITAAAIKQRGSSQALAVAIDVEHQLDDRAAVIGAVEVVDDRGRRIGARRDLPRAALDRGARTTYPFETPAGLGDGYYRILATVLARGEQSRTEELAMPQLYVHVAGGVITPVTSEEWLTRSNAGLAFTQP